MASNTIQNFINEPDLPTPGSEKVVPTKQGKGAKAAQAPASSQGSATPQQGNASAFNQQPPPTPPPANGKASARLAYMAGRRIGDNISDTADRVNQWAEGIPTPGGIWLILVALLMITWLVIPVNGNKTRMQLLWLTLTGQTVIPGNSDSATPTSTTTSAPVQGGTPPMQSLNGTTGLGLSGNVNNLLQDFSEGL